MLQKRMRTDVHFFRIQCSGKGVEAPNIVGKAIDSDK
jgi:hypothetical protein